METISVLMTRPMTKYLEQQLQTRFRLLKPWQESDSKTDTVRAVVTDASYGADSALIGILPSLEIVSSFSVGTDKIDLDECRERGIRVANTPEVLTDDVADAAIGLALAVVRRVCECDRFVRGGGWKNGDFEWGNKVSETADRFVPK